MDRGFLTQTAAWVAVFASPLLCPAQFAATLERPSVVLPGAAPPADLPKSLENGPAWTGTTVGENRGTANRAAPQIGKAGTTGSSGNEGKARANPTVAGLQKKTEPIAPARAASRPAEPQPLRGSSTEPKAEPPSPTVSFITLPVTQRPAPPGPSTSIRVGPVPSLATRLHQGSRPEQNLGRVAPGSPSSVVPRLVASPRTGEQPWTERSNPVPSQPAVSPTASTLAQGPADRRWIEGPPPAPRQTTAADTAPAAPASAEVEWTLGEQASVVIDLPRQPPLPPAPVHPEGHTAPSPHAPGLEIVQEPAGDDCATFVPPFFVTAEWLVWWFKKSPEPVPLVTAGSLADPVPGAIGQPNTRVVLGGADVDLQEHYGGRFMVGYWCDDEGHRGVEAGYSFLATRVAAQSLGANGGLNAPVLTVPILDVVAGVPGTGILPGGLPLAAPGVAAGAFREAFATRLQGAELNGIMNLADGHRFRLDGFYGFRFLDLHETLDFTTVTAGVPGSVFAGSLNTHDQFDTENFLFGGQAGVRAAWCLGCWSVDATARVAAGDLHEIVAVNGSTLALNVGPLTGVFPSGLFAQPGNIGRQTHDRVGIVPEGGVKVGYALSDSTRLFAGYDFLFMDRVVRPGNQIDAGINPTRTGLAQALGVVPVGPVRPALLLRESDFWAQGLSLGLSIHF